MNETKKKIGILTLHYANNYGAVLQCYGLQTVVNRLGFEAVIIDRVPVSADREGNFFSRIYQSFGKCVRDLLFGRDFDHFRRRFLPVKTSRAKNLDELSAASNSYWAVIAGSDQIWRPDFFRKMIPDYFLSFVPTGIKRISYAASFGNDTLDASSDTIDLMGRLLQSFDAISIREESGTRICREIFHIDAQTVLDPCLLLKASDYFPIIQSESHQSKEAPFISCYFLHPDDWKDQCLNTISEQLGIKKINLLYPKRAYPSVFPFGEKRPSVSVWLDSILRADYVVTDSFHGVAFSILLNKSFICLGNSKGCGNTRLENILAKVGLLDRLVLDPSSLESYLLKKPIDYVKVNRSLEEQRSFSMNFLINALN